MPSEPFVLVQVELGKAEVVKLGKVAVPRFGLTVADSVYPTSIFACVASAVAFTSVGPVRDVDCAVVVGAEGYAHEPRIGGDHEVIAVGGGVSGTLPGEPVIIDTSAMGIV